MFVPRDVQMLICYYVPVTHNGLIRVLFPVGLQFNGRDNDHTNDADVSQQPQLSSVTEPKENDLHKF